MTFQNVQNGVEVHLQSDGTWIAEPCHLPGCFAYGSTREEAIQKVEEKAQSWLRSEARNDQNLSLEDYAVVVRAASALRILGSNSNKEWRLPTNQECRELNMNSYSGIIDFSPNDQVVCVKGGTSLLLLQSELRKLDQCIPLVEWYDGWHLFGEGTIAGGLSINLPHLLEAECGSWRDWVLGMTLILADGTIAKTGSHAVKNVAGYDIHKLMIGARGTLAVIAEVILRTYPLKSLPEPNFESHPGETGRVTWFQRVLASDFEAASQAEGGGVGIPATSTIIRYLPEGETLPRYPGDWILRSGHLDIEDPTTIAYMKRAKALFDPTNKLNPGEFGFI